MYIIEALLAGAAIGAVLGFVGAGGAMLAVPILIYIFGFSASAATTAAIAVVMTAAAAGLIPKLKSKDVLISEAFIISALGLVTNVGLSLIAYRLPSDGIKTGFSLVLIIAASSMLIKPVSGSEKKVPIIWLIVISLIIGAITGLFGVGGGFLATPILVLFFKNSMAKAVGTSLLIIALNSVIAFFAHYKSWAEIDWQIPFIMAISAVIVSRLASMRGSIADPKFLRTSFAYLLYAISIFTFVQTWFIS
ncbi:MAG: sulfite exporter TauE/SafE family protein [Actinomycetota bacterium]|nr:sulfite exporter TauE/SafE family protein [Actinomycetota bacterium]